MRPRGVGSVRSLAQRGRCRGRASTVHLSVCWQGQSSTKGFQDSTTGDNLKATSQLVSVMYSNPMLGR